MRLIRSLAQSPIESLAALVLVGVGVYVSAIASTASAHKTGLLTAGGVLTTFGGVLFAWVVSKAFATEQVREDFQQQLGHLSRNLGQAAGQISRAVEQSDGRDISSETALALISQANRMIYGQVSEISVIQGTSFDPAYLLDTATKLDGLARQLASDREDGELEEVRRRIKEVQTSLSEATPDRTYSATGVSCPTCGADNEVKLGDFTGDTASAICEACKSKFNAHRRSDGSAITRPVVQKVATPEGDGRWWFSCPSCATPAAANHGVGSKTMVCFGCYSSLIVNLSEHTVTIGDGKFERTEAEIIGKKAKRPLVKCPKCGREVNAFISVDGDFVGLCYPDRQIMAVPRSKFIAYVAAEEGKSGNGTTTDLPVGKSRG